ncbi:hypothetical protein [Blastococcus xanthinilyticus]|uniref:Uncharacterized protein n=1 Tax=Blastococcus xanthinilyticus TaxID=1564164 RepID=A0A5S5CSR5_9ACTN|nr:hypothetical protein [Blastococcus xanthinilyticus]TYP86857.1 hypothetical protein BD833_108142 [Blastococcus xanthinilyticus]
MAVREPQNNDWIAAARFPPMTGGSELRKSLEARLRTALAERGFRRLRTKQYFQSGELAEPPLVAQLVVGVDTHRYGTVRMSGVAQVVCPAVDEVFASAPDDALTRGQWIYRGRLGNRVATRTFGRLENPARSEPLEWTADDEEQGDRALQDLLTFVDGPVRTWLDSRSSVALVRAAVDPGGEDESNGSVVRTASVLDALLGEPGRGVERLRRYAARPEEKVDSPEQVQAFLRWLHTVQPMRLD